MQVNFQKSVEFTLQDEGGFTNHPEDNGGPTNFGITISDLEEWRGKRVSIRDVREMKEEEAHAIYRERYWDPLRCDDLPAGVDYFIFNAGLLSGIVTAARWLQISVDAKTDGIIGPKTLEQVGKAEVPVILAEVEALWRRRLKSLSDWPTFGRGWSNRVTNVMRRAQKMIVEHEPVSDR